MFHTSSSMHSLEPIRSGQPVKHTQKARNCHWLWWSPAICKFHPAVILEYIANTHTWLDSLACWAMLMHHFGSMGGELTSEIKAHRWKLPQLPSWAVCLVILCSCVHLAIYGWCTHGSRLMACWSAIMHSLEPIRSGQPVKHTQKARNYHWSWWSPAICKFHPAVILEYIANTHTWLYSFAC